MRTRDIRVCQADFEVLQSLLDLLHIPYTYAPLEAETVCSDLCIRGCVDAVLSEDTDVFAYGTPLVISRIDIGSSSATCVNYSRVLDELELNSETFLDFCILCGTDYNPPISGMTPIHAYSFVRQYGCIDNIVTALPPAATERLNFVRVREIFRQYAHSALTYVPYVGIANSDAVFDFLRKHDGSAEYYRDFFSQRARGAPAPVASCTGNESSDGEGGDGSRRACSDDRFQSFSRNRGPLTRRQAPAMKLRSDTNWRAGADEYDVKSDDAPIERSVHRWFRPQSNLFGSSRKNFRFQHTINTNKSN
jgi:hypothetical protein